MYHVRNLRTRKLLRDACSGQTLLYPAQSDAEQAASTMDLYAVTANRSDRYRVEPARVTGTVT